jgi:type IV pilus assembly protein PilX
VKPPPAIERVRSVAPRRQRGFALITSLLILVVVTLLAVGMYRNFGLQEKIAGNTLEKQRSFQAAQSALQYGEWWLGQGNGGTGTACTGVLDGNTVASLKVCIDPLANPATLPWTARLDYTPPGMTVQADGGLNTGSTGLVGDVNYASRPSLYISYLGLGPDGKSMIYQVTGAGYGGSSTSASVVQSTYAMSFPTTDLGGPPS